MLTRHSLFRSLILLITSWFCTPASLAAVKVASMNLCSDQLIVALADSRDIVSVSYLSADPAYSAIASQVNGLHLNHGQAEELLPLQPELIVTGQFSASLAASLLERLNFTVLRQPVANSADDIYRQIDTLAAALGRSSEGQVLTAEIQRAIASSTQHLRKQLSGKSAIFFSSNGFTYGSNTLQHSFLESLGIENAASALSGPAQLTLETLISLQPDYLIINPPTMLDQQLAHPLLRHPVLSAVQTTMQTLVLPDAYFQCAGPLFVKAYQDLEEQL